MVVQVTDIVVVAENEAMDMQQPLILKAIIYKVH